MSNLSNNRCIDRQSFSLIPQIKVINISIAKITKSYSFLRNVSK
jgi:hypothetical protein